MQGGERAMSRERLRPRSRSREGDTAVGSMQRSEGAAWSIPLVQPLVFLGVTGSGGEGGRGLLGRINEQRRRGRLRYLRQRHIDVRRCITMRWSLDDTAALVQYYGHSCVRPLVLYMPHGIELGEMCVQSMRGVAWRACAQTAIPPATMPATPLFLCGPKPKPERRNYSIYTAL